MDNIAGTPVEGKNFFGRKSDIHRLLELLENHDVLLLGARRIGKTSISRAVMKELRAKGWRAIEINVASATDERGFLEKLGEAVREEAHSMLRKSWDGAVESVSKILGRIKSVKITVPGDVGAGVELGGGEEDWTTVGNDVLALLAGRDEPWLIYVDELPILLYNILRNDQLNGVQRVRRFLDWFRNDVRGLAGDNQVRWLLTGSVGLDTLVQQHGMADTINSLKHEGLPEFTLEESLELLQSLSNAYDMTMGHAEATTLIDAVQWRQPYYIQAAFSKLRSLLAAQGEQITAEHVERAVAQMAEPGQDNDFQHWEIRLVLQLPKPDADHAAFLLENSCATRDGVRAELLFALFQERLPDKSREEAKRAFVYLRDILLRDAYWTADGEGAEKRYRFRLEPLRRWWHRRNSL